MRLLISLEVECHMLGSEPFVKEARIYRERIGRINQVLFKNSLFHIILYHSTYTVHVNGVP